MRAIAAAALAALASGCWLGESFSGVDTTAYVADSFEEDDLNAAPPGWIVDSGTWRVVAGPSGGHVLRQTRAGAPLDYPYTIHLDRGDLTDYTAHVELDVEDATCSILVGVRAQPSQIQDLYDFVAYPPQTGWQLYSTAGNDLQNRVSFAGGTWSMPGGHHVIELTVIGPMINLTVDGDPPLNFNDVTYPSGTLALASCEHGYFDNVLVTPVK